ncbi:MAG: T9SS type A sorting domain-containing protein [Bacteroidales bacterium]|nr:T9SS type A sorting domain-containing protein [Bacteroidales bacterium]
MKRYFLAAFILFYCCVVKAQKIDTISFSTDNVELYTDSGYTRVVMNSCETTEEIGCPELPRLELSYILPYNSKISSVVIIDSTKVLLSNNVIIYPKQPEYPMDDTIQHEFVNPSRDVYESDRSYPFKIIDVSQQYYEKGFHIAKLNVYPIFYTPNENTIELYTNIRFQINYEDNEPTLTRPKTQARYMYNLTENMMYHRIRNKSDFALCEKGPLNIPLGPNIPAHHYISLLDMENDIDPEYIIITNNYDVNGNLIEDAEHPGVLLTDVFQDFANWKTQTGLPTKVVTIDEISSNYNGDDIQEKVHNFLVDVYHNYGSLYILFGGDTNIVPERMMYCSHGDYDFLPSDLYYVAVESSWNNNFNNIYGESGDIDLEYENPQFYYGRASVESISEARTFVDKSYKYENLANILPAQRDYVNNIVAMAKNIFNSRSVELGLGRTINKYNSLGSLIEQLDYGITQSQVEKWRLYVENFHYNNDTLLFVAGNNNIRIGNSWNWENHNMLFSKETALGCFGSRIPLSSEENPKQGHLVFHIDHSSYLSMGTSSEIMHQTINRTDVDGFLNAPFYQIIYTAGCYPGEYHKDCITEHFINNPNGGAVAMFASSSTSSGEYKGFVGILKDMYYFVDNNISTSPHIYTLGALHDNNLSKGGLSDSFNKRKHHLFGDPTIGVWTRKPEDLTVVTIPSVISNQENQLTVSVSGMVYTEYATNDVVVCVMKDNEIYLREHYNGSTPNHDFVFSINPETAGELKVTVTGHNYIPYETTIPVSITGKNIFISEKSVLDASGNNDGNMDAGETVNLSISLNNNGTTNLTNVSATLSCEFLNDSLNQNIGNYITLSVPTALFGTINKNTTVTRNNYQLTLSKGIPDRTSLRFTLTISDGSGIIANKVFVLPITSPKIEYVSIHHEVKPNGKIGLDIDLSNLGYGSAKNVSATLSSSNVQITQGTNSYGNMTHNESNIKAFEFIPNGSIDGKTFALSISDAYNNNWCYNFNINVISNTVENLSFENTENSIKLIWAPINNAKGYYIYRSSEENGVYNRLNNYPISSSVYSDLGLGAMQTYYYGVSYIDEMGNESQKSHIKAWTSLPVASGWPVIIPDNLGRAWFTAPNVADITHDGKQEIIITTGNGENIDNKGAILCLNNIGDELYDIDHNPTTISGFANIGVNMTCTPAVGDIDNDGIIEIVVATRDLNENNDNKLCVYKNADINQDGNPDLIWEHDIAYRNFNGVVLDDLNNDGMLEIIAPNQGRNGRYNHTYMEVFDCYGNYYYPQNKIKVVDTCNHDEKAVTMPVVSDMDNDGYKEIVFGLERGLYMWSCDNDTLIPLLINGSVETGRKDCPVIVADIDNDEDLEVVYMSIKDTMGYIKAINKNGLLVNGWDDNSHYISLSQGFPYWEWPPYFSIADIDHDGDVEIFVADKDTLKMWSRDGSYFGIGEIVIEGLDCRYFQPIIADVDNLGDCEIIIPSNNGYIYAYKTNGNSVEGWPLLVNDIASIPVVTDIDDDGLNEVIAASHTAIYVWHTQGRSTNNQQDRFRYNKHNNAVYDLPCSHINNPMEIFDIQIWNCDKSINKDVVLNSGASLTVKSELKMSQNSRIIIKPGGHLILDGCKLTSACSDETWQGIEVWGNSSAHQYPVNGGYLQGYLEMKNGATIENAVCAVELCRPNYGNTTGGIIHASNAVFRNNAKSVHACYYSNHTPTNGAEVSYNSWFRNCTFTIDENYLGTETFYKHVDMEHVKGISFKGCDFSVLPNIDGVSSSCMGIGAYEAGFAVESYCDDIYNDPCPENSIIRSTFTGFNNGILSVNDGSNACAFSVKDAVFTNNNRGIYAQNTGFATILRNEFNIKSSGSICGYGVYAEGITGFCIEENIFVPATNTRSHKYGVGIFNSRSVNDVYLNSFENLTCGNLAYGINHTADLNGRPPAIVFGLTYSCNDNTDNAIDFCVLKDIGSEGIGSLQGSASSPAGNTFGGNQYHFYNDGSYPVNYYYNANSSYEIPNTSKLFGVNTYSTTYNNSCASHYGGGSVSKSPEEKAALADAYKLADDEYNQLVEMYDSQIAAGITPKTELIAQIYQYAHERNMAAGDIVRSDLNDSVANPTELRQWLGKMHDIAADRMAVASYMHEGDFKNALVLANSFPDVYSLKDDDLSDHNDYMKLLALYQTLYNSNRTVHEMTKEELVVVNSIAEYGLGTSRLMARAIMMEVSDRFVEPYICPELPGWNSRGENSNTDYSCEENDGYKVSVTPIPATTFVSVEYKLPDNTTKATMAITNVLGVKKIEMEVKGNQGVETIDISNLTPGIYILKVKTTDGKEYTERIVKE